MKSITLYNTLNGRDAVYQLQIETSGAGFVVNYQNGRRGGTLASGTKTKSPVDYETAIKVFDKIVAEKTGKGYTEGEGGTAYVGTDKAERVSGYLPQLLNPVDESQLRRMLADHNYVAMEKYDGKCMLLQFKDGVAQAINRTGLFCGAPEPILAEFQAQCEICPDAETVIHGECVGDTFYAYDLLILHGRDARPDGFTDRHALLYSIIDPEGGPIIQAPYVVNGHKESFHRSLFDANKEGIVLKQKDAPYTPGRPSSGGTQYKFKFQSEATCIVTGVSSTKRSFDVGVLASGIVTPADVVHMGSVAVPNNKPFPEVGQLVEIRYLYAFPNGGNLYQPFFKGIRDDKTEADRYETLKFKPEANHG
jgi:bifunctional non-homologous end joining protein LigD